MQARFVCRGDGEPEAQPCERGGGGWRREEAEQEEEALDEWGWRGRCGRIVSVLVFVCGGQCDGV